MEIPRGILLFASRTERSPAGRFNLNRRVWADSRLSQQRPHLSHPLPGRQIPPVLLQRKPDQCGNGQWRLRRLGVRGYDNEQQRGRTQPRQVL